MKQSNQYLKWLGFVIVSVVIICACMFVYYSIYFFEDSIFVNVSEEEWTTIYLCEKRDYDICSEVVNHAMNIYTYNVRYVDTDTNEVLQTVQIEAGRGQKNVIEKNHNFTIEVKQKLGMFSEVEANDNNKSFHITYYPDNVFSCVLNNMF